MRMCLLSRSDRFAAAVRAAIGDLSISQAAYKTGISYEYVRTMVSYGRVPSETILVKFAEGLGVDLETLRVAAGYEASDPVDRVKFALEGQDELEDWQIEAIQRLAESKRRPKQ